MFEKLTLHEAFQSVKHTAQLADSHVSVATFYNLVQLCVNEKNICIGRKVHILIVDCGYESNRFLASHMIRLFAVCGNLAEANRVFEKVQEPDVFTWNAIISAHAKLGDDEEALSLYNQLNNFGFSLDAHIYVAVLKACHSLVHLLLIHAQLIESGLYSGIYIPVTLLDVYTKYGNVEEVLTIFNSLQEKSVVAWNALIKGCNHHARTDDALQFFLQMQMEGLFPTHVTCVTVLKTCSDAAALSQGYVQHGHISKALGVFQDMQRTGVESNQITFSTVVKGCCSSVMYSDQGMLLHAIIIESGLEMNLYVSSTLINMYAKWGSVEDGRDVFAKSQKPSLIIWSALIACYAQNDLGIEAIDAFEKMQLEGFEPNQVLYASVLRACSDLGTLDLGKLMHTQIIESGLVFNVFVASTLIDMYAKCNSFADACNVFNRFSKGNVVTWSAMIAGHAGVEENAEALDLFNGMQNDGVDPNEVTFIALLSLCANIAAVDQGMLIHAQIMEMGLEADLPLSNSLVDMYANCGVLHDACKILEKSTEKSVVTWNSLIAGCAKHSDYEAALNCLNAMLGQSVPPNDVTFVSILALCNHMGLVHEALFHLTSMTNTYGILPRYQHYMCTLDLLGRAGSFDEAEDIVNTMPSCPDFVSLASLLNHCKTYENSELAKQYFNGIVTFDSRSALSFANMLTIYDAEGLKGCSDLLDSFRNNANAWKKPGMACLEVEDEEYRFVVGDKTSEEIAGVSLKLKSLTALIREEGYLPQAVFGSGH
ncbi:hypothetical protein L7F22_034868 [Adiantum nelumboides]|nr:hypothetical protein [Adiantum nelumboides]